MPRPAEKTQDELSDAGAGPIVAAEGKVTPGAKTGKKDVKRYERSRNVYENKQSTDDLPENKATFFHDFHTFYANAPVFCRILQKSTAFLSLWSAGK